MKFIITVPQIWPSGDCRVVALLDLAEADLERIARCHLVTGTEAGLGRWSGIGLRSPGGPPFELVLYHAPSAKGVELRLDSKAEIAPTRAAVIAALGVAPEAVIWTL